MARGKHDFTVRRDERTGVYTVRFRHAGQRFHRSTGETDRLAAERAATRLVEEVVTGRRAKLGTKAPPLADLFGAWLASYAPRRSQETVDEIERYAGTYFLPFFRSLPNITIVTIDDYMNARLRVVKAATVKKELSALRIFLAWCESRGILKEAPRVRRIESRTTGTANTKRMQIRVDLTPIQVEAFLRALPEVGRNGTFPIRDFIALAWETSLRVGTLARLRAPEHFRSGMRSLHITPDIDKSRYGRDLPLSDKARRILERHVPDDGLIFGRYDMRQATRKAGLAIGLPEELARRVGPHDLRHAAITDIASAPSASIAGIAYAAGHKTATVTARYIHAGKDAATAALRARGTSARGTPRGTRANPAAKIARKGKSRKDRKS